MAFSIEIPAWTIPLAQPGAGNRTLCISIGGGLGTILLLNMAASARFPFLSGG